MHVKSRAFETGFLLAIYLFVLSPVATAQNADSVRETVTDAEVKLHSIAVTPDIEKIYFRDAPAPEPRKRSFFFSAKPEALPRFAVVPERDDIEFVMLGATDTRSVLGIFTRQLPPRQVIVNRKAKRYLSDHEVPNKRRLYNYNGTDLILALEEGERFLDFSNEGRFVVAHKSTSELSTRQIRIYDAENGKRLHEVTVPCGDKVYFSPDAMQFAARDTREASFEYTLWNTRTGEAIRKLIGTDSRRPYTGHAKSELTHPWSPDGKFFLHMETHDFNVGIWNIESGQRERLLEFSRHCCTARYSPDGSRVLVVGGMAQHIMKSDSQLLVGALYNGETGERVQSFAAAETYVTDAVFSNDGKFIFASGSTVRGLHVWKVGEPRAEPQREIFKKR